MFRDTSVKMGKITLKCWSFGRGYICYSYSVKWLNLTRYPLCALDLKARKQVTLEQLKGLLEYLNEHQDLAKGLTRGRRGKLHSVKLWNVCAKKLNSIIEGAVKDGKGWSKYWCDWKYRVRRRALELKAARDSNKPPPDGVASLSQMEESILAIIGESVVSGVVIKSDPLAEGVSFSDEEESYMADNSEEAPINYGITKSKRGKKRRHSSQNMSNADDEIGTSSPHERKRNKLETENESDEDESASELIRLEKEKLECTKQFLETTREISSHMGKLVGVMTRIKDFLLMNHRVE